MMAFAWRIAIGVAISNGMLLLLVMADSPKSVFSAAVVSCSVLLVLTAVMVLSILGLSRTNRALAYIGAGIIGLVSTLLPIGLYGYYLCYLEGPWTAEQVVGLHAMSAVALMILMRVVVSPSIDRYIARQDGIYDFVNGVLRPPLGENVAALRLSLSEAPKQGKLTLLVGIGYLASAVIPVLLSRPGAVVGVLSIAIAWFSVLSAMIAASKVACRYWAWEKREKRQATIELPLTNA